ncbi:hypothetical protein V1L54_01805 [Streptomyces sp. TRM 70361]|uniref:hypothetical protein n=1 Tax=Streptomyces sp. TRM 70361 TaxID=3116553 RepID=UPI002E7C252C|nr:hypothetical protein [Streptomyces sp. TRM 70361]MEE1938162.1 hypothetical protein [Streptomyces sp. TRM 70361]
MEFVIGLMALFFVLFATAGTIAAVKTARAVKRGVERAGVQARRTVEDTALKARGAQPGPAGELARLRLELRSSLDSTRRALETGMRHDPSLSESVGLLDRLDEHARQLDGELRLLMDREPDRSRIAARLPEARERAQRIRSSADSLRFAAQDRAQRYDEDELAALSQQIELEAGALRHWTEPDAVPGAGTGPAPGITGPVPAPGIPGGSDASGPSGLSAPSDLGASAPEAPRRTDLRKDGAPEPGPEPGRESGREPGPDFGRGRPQSA